MKEDILNILDLHRGDYISGQDLAEKLEVSRTAIWKMIEKLRDQGYEIEAVNRKGYRLVGNFDRLTEGGIRKNLRPELKNMSLKIFEEIDSTNTEMKRWLEEGDVHTFDAILAEGQTKGRGRSGKTFESPLHTGAYLTLLWYKEGEGDLRDQDLITIKVSLAVARAVEALTDLKPGIKWVNDVLIDHRKFCGILTEADFSLEDQKISAIYTGIGLNVRTPQEVFSEEIQNKAGSLNTDVLRNDLVAELLNQLYEVKTQGKDQVIAAYKSYSVVLNREISFQYNGVKKRGLVKDINEEGHLIVDCGKEVIELNAGEVSIEGDFY